MGTDALSIMNPAEARNAMYEMHCGGLVAVHIDGGTQEHVQDIQLGQQNAVQAWAFYTTFAGIGPYSVERNIPAGLVATAQYVSRMPTDEEVAMDQAVIGAEQLGNSSEGVMRFGSAHVYTRFFTGDIPPDISGLVAEASAHCEEPRFGLTNGGIYLHHAVDGVISLAAAFSQPEEFARDLMTSGGHITVTDGRILHYPPIKREPIDISAYLAAH